MISLDDAAALARVDRDGMLGLLESFPLQCREGWSLGADLAGRAGSQPPSSLVIAGMGGSAIAGDLVRGLLSTELPMAVTVVRDYVMPGWVGPDTTVVCCSYSGDTEETLSAFGHALRLGSRVVAVTSGGALSREASSRGLPCLKVPPGLPPRAALGYSLFGLIAIVDGWGLTRPLGGEAEESFGALEEGAAWWGAEAPEGRNEAKKLAKELCRTLPVICAPEGPLGAVGLRWKTQFNENSKLVAYNCLFPELDHNEIVGWARPFNVGGAVAVFLRSADEPERLRLRMEITRDMFEEAGLPVKEVWGVPARPMAQMAALTLLGDYVSVYAALLRGVDPTPVDAIGVMKERLSKGQKK